MEGLWNYRTYRRAQYTWLGLTKLQQWQRITVDRRLLARSHL